VCCCFELSAERLLEDLALVELAAILIGTGPGEVLGDQLLGLLALGIELLPVVDLVVDLPVWRQGEGQILSAPHPDAGDGAVAVLAEQANGSEGRLAHLVQTLEHAGDEIARHEHLGQLLVVLVLANPDRVVLGIELLEEVGNGLRLLLVGVDALRILDLL